jgi:L-2-hydroxyglutarate oxidase LhgO
VEGRDRLYRFCDEHQVPHARCGKLIVAADEHEIAELDRLLAVGHANGVSSLVRVDGVFVRAKEPNVRAVGALWSPDTGILEAEALVKTLERLCRANDVALVVGSPVIDAAPRTSGIELVTPHEQIVA